ncbi:MAG TPA: hypothetical protein VJ910_05760 [Desulfuromonadales bacterium]|nr:hypothetical protein [Desulfuromonadales bacterium]
MNFASESKPSLDRHSAHNLQRALTAGSEQLYQVLQGSSSQVLTAALKNPALNTDHITFLLKRRDLSEALLQKIHQLEQVKQSRQLQIDLVRNPGTPSAIVLSILPRLHLFELVDLCYIPGVTPDQKFAAERAIIKRLPATELGQRLTLARRATPTVVAQLLKSGETPLVEICLHNPRLREVAILQFLNGATAKDATISLIARHPKWQMRPNLRMAILRHPRTPRIWFTLFLPRMNSLDVRNLLASPRLTSVQKKYIREELQKRSG